VLLMISHSSSHRDRLLVRYYLVRLYAPLGHASANSDNRHRFTLEPVSISPYYVISS
jgi:hypothetical protein